MMINEKGERREKKQTGSGRKMRCLKNRAGTTVSWLQG